MGGTIVKKKNTVLKYCISLGVLSIIALIFVTQFDFERIIKILANTNLPLLILAAIVYYSSFVTKTLRWKILLEGVGIKEKFSHVFASMFMCYFFNSLIPFRAGDFYRAYLIKKRRDVAFSKGIGTLFVEKAFDIVILVLILTGAGLLVLSQFSSAFISQLLVIGIVLLGVIILISIVCLIFFSRQVVLFSEKITKTIRNFSEVIHISLNDRKVLVGVVVTSVLDWCVVFLFFYLISLSLGLELSVLIVAFIVVVENLLTIIPLTPAGLGFVELGVGGILIAIGTEKNLSIAIALLMRFVAYWLQILFGAIAYFILKHEKIFLKSHDK